MSRPLQAKGYLRLSRSKDDDYSMRKQLQAVKDTIRHRNERAETIGGSRYAFDDGGWSPDRGGGVFGDLHVDIDKSAFRMDVRRPAHQALMALGDVDLIVVWEATRWDRRMLRFVASLQTLQERGIGFVSARQPDLDTTGALGQLIVLLHAAFAEFESETISRRSKESREQRAELGLYVGGTPPVGYRSCTPDEQDAAGSEGPFLVQEEDEAAVLQIAAQLVLDGSSWASAARRLNELGHKTRSGGQWRGPNLAKYLTGAATAGFVPRGDDFVRSPSGDRVRLVADPVLDEATWNELRAKLRRRPGGARVETLLHGIAVCASCGGSLRGSGSRYRTYACPRGSDGADVCAQPAIVKREALDSMVERYVLQRLAAAPVVGGEASETDELRVQLEEELRQLRAALGRLEEDRLAGMYDHSVDRYRHQYREQTGRVAEVEAELASWSGADRRRELTPIGEEAWSLLPVGERRQIIGLLVQEVRVTKAGQGKRFDPRRVEVVALSEGVRGGR